MKLACDSVTEADDVSDNKDGIPCLDGIFNVIISGTLQMIVTVTADSSGDAEQIVSDNWRAGDYILDAENFIGVEFKSVPLRI